MWYTKILSIHTSITTQHIYFLQRVVKMAAIFFLLVLLTSGIGQAFSHCMADCNIGQHGPSLYEQYCCIFSNKGKRFHLKDNDLTRFILCPSTRPTSCPCKISIYYLYFITISTSVSSGNSNRL